MKHWWKQSALYNAEPCTPLHFQLIRSAQLQKGERLPRQPPISPPPSPSVPLSRLLSAEVAWQREVQPLLYWNQCKNMHLHNKACVESWEQWGKTEAAHLWAAVQSKNKKKQKKKDFKREDLSWRFAFICSGHNGIVLPTRVYPWNLRSPLWASECFASWCGALRGLRITRVGAEVRPRTDVREECTEWNSPTSFFFCLSCSGVVFAETIVSQRRWKWFHAFSLAQPEMDVRFYPAPPANVGSCSLPTDPSCLSPLDYYHSNKVNNKLCSLVRWNA